MVLVIVGEPVDKAQTCIIDRTVIHERAVELLPLPSWEVGSPDGNLLTFGVQRAGVRVR